MRKYLSIVCLFCLPVVFLAGCTKGEVNWDSSVMEESKQTEVNHKRLTKAVPPPTFDTSLEREVLVKRLKAMNVQNKVMYIYCMGLNGNVVYQGLVQGKVASLNSLLTTPTQIVAVRGYGNSYTYHQMPSPDFDGSYGKNPEGIFWFDTTGGYHEWSGTYFLSDRPQKVNVPVSLSTTVDLEKKQ